MDNKVKEFINMSLDILYTMSTNWASDAQLVKVPQLVIDDI